MLFQIYFKPHHCRRLRKITDFKSYCTQAAEYIYPKFEDEFDEVPQYPPIERKYPGYIKHKELQEWYDKIKRQKTVEEKLIEMNVPRYWGWKCLLLKETNIPYNSLEFFKFITRTHVIETDELPGSYQEISGKCSEHATKISSEVEDLIEDNLWKVRHKFSFYSEIDKGREFSNVIIAGLNRLVLKSLQSTNESLKNMQIDYSPRIESFWNMGSLTETFIPEKYPHGLKPEEIPEEYLDRPTDKYIQYIGQPLIQLRTENPLPPLINHKEALYFQYPVPLYKYDPVLVFGFEMARRHVTNIPGFWPGESREFSFLSYHDISHIEGRPETYGPEDANETLQSQAVISSFAWLMSLTSYQGFTSFHDITYPFVTQTILSDGREFAFAVYQLNTTEYHHSDPLMNPKCNICWITPKMKLYDIEDGKIKVNLQVIKKILQFYLIKTEDRDKCVRKPYLDENLGVVANYEHEEKRCWLERMYKHISSNRPRGRLDKMYEVADYERIFKIQFKMMPRDSRTRPFELRENPYLRKLSDHAPEYIPRKLRVDAHLPKYKQQKFRKTYYPE